MAEIKNRELSQFSSFLHIEDQTECIGITTSIDTPFVGIGTTNATSKLTVNGDVLVSGVLTASTLSAPTIAIGSASVTSGSVTILSGGSLFYSGIGTINSLVSSSGIITNFTSGISSIAQLRVLSGIVTNISGTALTYTSGNFTNLYATNSYLVTGIATNLSGSTINYTGLSTFSGVQIQSGIITATNAGIVTYYGDGSKLLNTISGVGIRSDGDLIGYGATTINFTGSGISTVSFNASVGIATIIIEGTQINSLDTQVLYNNAGSIAGSANFTFNGDALVSIAGTCEATNFNTTSDLTVKENVRTIENALEIVSELRGVRFDWIENHSPSLGVIAQEVEEVLPELISHSTHKTVNYNGIIGVLIEAIKELQAEIQDLKNNK
jgi:hypothetical protein